MNKKLNVLSLKSIREKKENLIKQNIMRTTNITAEMVYITPEVAKKYLECNRRNRPVSRLNKNFISGQMKNNTWVENGESIVFDINGELKDGQHRLESIIHSGKSYWFPVVRGVSSKSMATIDTGKNRTAADVLHLNGFKYSTSMAACIKSIFKYDFKKSKNADAISSQRSVSPTNQQVLDYCEENYNLLIPMIKKIHSIYNQQSNPKPFNTTQLFIFIYMIGGLNPTKKHYEFLIYIAGVNKQFGTAADYIYNKSIDSKIKKEPLNFYWVLGMVLKAWNYYADGNPSIKYYRFNVSDSLPKVIKYNS